MLLCLTLLSTKIKDNCNFNALHSKLSEILWFKCQYLHFDSQKNRIFCQQHYLKITDEKSNECMYIFSFNSVLFTICESLAYLHSLITIWAKGTLRKDSRACRAAEYRKVVHYIKVLTELLTIIRFADSIFCDFRC